MRVDLRHGDCLDEMAKLGDRAVGQILCDPPYGLEFLGHEWDSLQPGGLQMQRWHERWLREAHRVLVAGGTIKVFGGTRVYHRLAAAMERVGFAEIHQEAWGYSSGMPKSLSLDRALQKASGVNPTTQVAVQRYLRQAREAKGLTKRAVDMAVFGGTTRYSWVEGRGGLRAKEVYLPTPEEWEALKGVLDLDDRFDEYIRTAIPPREHRARIDGGKGRLVREESGDWGYQQNRQRWDGVRRITEAVDADARHWTGWETALKPAWEPILVGVKPVVGKV